jgi:radical SAM protein (TIGR01212 family)
MSKVTQRESNPFPFSDSNKRYYTYEYYLRRTFGKKCAKLPIDAGFTCPNIDGTCGTGGCIYCSGRGSGDFAESSSLGIAEQIRAEREKLGRKWDTSFCIPYFQAHTNTYASLSVLREKYEEALAQPGVVGLNIATRADCLPDDTVKYLAELSERTVLTVELGLQTIHDITAELINRGHNYLDFLRGYKQLRNAGGRINICLHLILGLPGEDDSMMEATAREVARLHPEQVKIHLLHVLKGTELEKMYHDGKYIPLERARYINLVTRTLEVLPPDVVIGRLTGDGAENNLVAPLWSLKKTTVVNDIDKKLFADGSMQGRFYKQ